MSNYSRRRVILESPYSGDIQRNTAYARAAVKDSLARGEAPFAPHLIYTQPGILDDDIEEEREAGIDAGLSWLYGAMASVVYTDYGISAGMAKGISRAQSLNIPVEYRTLPEKLDESSNGPIPNSASDEMGSCSS